MQAEEIWSGVGGGAGSGSGKGKVVGFGVAGNEKITRGLVIGVLGVVGSLEVPMVKPGCPLT
jgi:hypothetical protein